MISSKTSKSTAIKEIGILEESKAIYTIGDSYNDICMIEDYRGSIMKNAVSELKDKNYKEYESVSEFIEDVLENEE
ncbi:MAG: HAD hydrolase family protein [Bacilli bacterium]|nr:HAD hydrolase family protein [Bacilli bacterium]